MPHAIGAKYARFEHRAVRGLLPVAINLRGPWTTVRNVPRGAILPQSQPLSWYHLAVRCTPSVKRTSGFQPRSSWVFELSQTQ
jgi:hypothetical protein